MFFCGKKGLRQGCTKPKTELGMHQNQYFHENPLKINKHQKVNPPSTITVPESGNIEFEQVVPSKRAIMHANMNGWNCGSDGENSRCSAQETDLAYLDGLDPYNAQISAKTKSDFGLDFQVWVHRSIQSQRS